MRQAFKIVLLSGLLAAAPAFFAGMVMREIPAMRPQIEMAVCGPGSTLGTRTTMSNAMNVSRTVHCVAADGTYSEAVSGRLIGQGMRLAWPVLTVAIALIWWIVVLARGNRPAAVAGQPVRITPLTVHLPPTTEVEVEGGPETAAVLERILRRGGASDGDVQELLSTLQKQGGGASEDG